jgi:hypothetical protein
MNFLTFIFWVIAKQKTFQSTQAISFGKLNEAGFNVILLLWLILFVYFSV